MKVCSKCKHLMPEIGHSCPTPEYLKAKAALISSAVEAEELFSLEELEDFANKKRDTDH